MRLRPPLARAAQRHPRLHRAGGGKGGLPKELGQLDRLLGRGLAATAEQWPALRTAYGWVHQAAHLLANPEDQPGAAVRAAYQTRLDTMPAPRDTLGPLAPAVDQFRKVTASYWPGLFHCYDVPDLPRTNNDLERRFGMLRYHERRATGRRSLPGTVVLRGAVRVVTILTADRCDDDPPDLRPSDYAAWWGLRPQLEERSESRRAQRRFRRDPDAYLTALEQQLLQ